jgi:hypothetical protein
MVFEINCTRSPKHVGWTKIDGTNLLPHEVVDVRHKALEVQDLLHKPFHSNHLVPAVDVFLYTIFRLQYTVHSAFIN